MKTRARIPTPTTPYYFSPISDWTSRVLYREAAPSQAHATARRRRITEDTENGTGLRCAKYDLKRGSFLAHSVPVLPHRSHAQAICYLRKITKAASAARVGRRSLEVITVAITYDANEIHCMLTTMNTKSSCWLIPADEQVVDLIWQFVAEKSLSVWEAVAAMAECTPHEAFATFCAGITHTDGPHRDVRSGVGCNSWL